MTVNAVNVYVATPGGCAVIAEILTDEGVSGIGEAAVGFGIGRNAAAAMIADLAEHFVVGKNPKNISDIWNDFYFHTFWGKGSGAIFYAAVSALEQALWDIKGKTLGVPVYELLGGKQRDELPVYANGWSDRGFTSPESLAERAAEVVAAGYDAIKMYPLSQFDKKRNTNLHLKNRVITRDEYRRCVAAVEKVREIIGDDVELMADMTAEGTADVMTHIGQALEPYNLLWYEEPLDAFDIDAYVALKQKVNISIATGERLFTRYGFRRVIELRAVDIVQPDPGTCGGIMEAYKIASMAETYSMRIAPHNCGGPVLTAAAVQVSACTTNFLIQEVFPFRPPAMYDILEDPLELKIVNGRLKVPETPGLGAALNHDFVDRYRTHRVTL